MKNEAGRRSSGELPPLKSLKNQKIDSRSWQAARGGAASKKRKAGENKEDDEKRILLRWGPKEKGKGGETRVAETSRSFLVRER